MQTVQNRGKFGAQSGGTLIVEKRRQLGGTALKERKNQGGEASHWLSCGIFLLAELIAGQEGKVCRFLLDL